MTRATAILLSFSLLSVIPIGAPQATAQGVKNEGYVDAGSGVRLFYRLLGTGGEPVILIHGGPGFTSDYLADDMAPMARNRSVFIYDQRGIGKSTLVSDSTGLAAQRYVEDLEAIRKHLGLEQLTLLGHSWGGAGRVVCDAIPASRAPHDPRWDDPVPAQRDGGRVREDGCEPR